MIQRTKRSIYLINNHLQWTTSLEITKEVNQSYAIELKTLSLTLTFVSIESENDLFRKLPTTIYNRIWRSVYNLRTLNLVNHMDVIRLKSTSCFNEFENNFIKDRMSLEVCKF